MPLVFVVLPLGFMRCYSFQCLGGTTVLETLKISEESLEFAHAPVYYPLTDPILHWSMGTVSSCSVIKYNLEVYFPPLSDLRVLMWLHLT